ncbi:imelysin family protein [Paragemmobacter straminiformis]|uniref:Peptidase n=1 Tax=Paragemmobacter straminiformis TaxID=2045119 RepID=A0A842I609_9RHOB|nr:imelysin family protein [Gemmobacter straminiformis]MBC2834817.1 peptidase [Gemmobacter straminiformis]
MHRALPLFLALLPAPIAAAGTAATPAAVVETYADIAEATFADSLAAARDLQTAVDALLAAPAAETLAQARAAWVAARIPYQQSEVFRFGNPAVDDWEGRVNAWPLDEGLIDYVATPPDAANPLATLNVIATPRFTLSGTAVDATRITPALIADTLHEAGGSEANVASGYHAIEFLLWGQDLNGTRAGAGDRPHTDYLQTAACTHGHCDRRAAYLSAATRLLVADLAEMAAQWSATGAARRALTTAPEAALGAMVTGMGSLSYGELAGERMKLGLMLNDPEEEQDCFSDTTANSHYFNGLGVQNVYLGRYLRRDGTTLSGPALADLVAAADPATDSRLRAELDASLSALDALRLSAASGVAYDQLLAPDNADGAALIRSAIGALVTQTDTLARAAGALGLDRIAFEGSDSLDTPDAVFQ